MLRCGSKPKAGLELVGLVLLQVFIGFAFIASFLVYKFTDVRKIQPPFNFRTEKRAYM
jgi:hypothetical protein